MVGHDSGEVLSVMKIQNYPWNLGITNFIPTVVPPFSPSNGLTLWLVLIFSLNFQIIDVIASFAMVFLLITFFFHDSSLQEILAFERLFVCRRPRNIPPIHSPCAADSANQLRWKGQEVFLTTSTKMESSMNGCCIVFMLKSSV